MKNQDEGKLIKIEIADASGHQTLMLNPQQTQQYVSTQEQMWIFVDNCLIKSENLANVDWNEAISVRIMPGLVGGITDTPIMFTYQTKVEQITDCNSETGDSWND